MGNSIIVTGASSGLGCALVKELARKGHRVIACARPSKRLDAVGSLANVVVVPLDLANLDDLQVWAADVVRTYGPFAAIIHNAGIQVDKTLMQTSDDEIMREVDVNLTAPVILSRHLVPHIESGGRLMFIGSVLGYVPKPVSAVYSASKAGLRLFAAGVRLQHSKIIVQDVMVPVLDTAMTAHRGGRKMGADVAAKAIVTGMQGHSDVIWVGKTKIIRLLLRIAPRLAARIIGK